ncbi:MAG: DEAD/DEAH box helicase [Oscillospiraceae bacterium]|nr:DEAD/DEAH box helicase [Oscillospiraceae bacterium]
MTYENFIAGKAITVAARGFDIPVGELNSILFEFQRDIVRWALGRGRAAIFADCGDGKTAMQLEWAEQIRRRTNGSVIVIAPLAVAAQTKREGEKFGIAVNICASQSDVRADMVNITNYEKLDKFSAESFTAVVLDESSILKSFSGKIRNQIISMFAKTPYKLACTATPAPNDYMELGNHSEFIGVMTRAEMLAMYFVHDGGETSKWRLKGHAESLFWKWLSTWCVVMDDPKKLGYDIDGYDLPALNVHQIIADGDTVTNETLSLAERREARRESLESRCKAAAELVNSSSENWLVWCDLNDEAATLHKLIDNSVNVQGSDTPEFKSRLMLDFAEGKLKCLITKPKIAGYGMNWQNCHNVIFVGLSDSFEAYYQAVRRCWRFGQRNAVDVYIIISAREGAVKENIERKQTENERMKAQLIELTRDITKRELTVQCRISTAYSAALEMQLPSWEEFKVG